MTRFGVSLLAATAMGLLPQTALAVRGAELYTAESYGYGRVEARVRFAAGDGVVSSFFMWKQGSELAGTFWNELDFEKVDLCELETNPIYGNPPKNHSRHHPLDTDICGAFHVYTYEWTPDYITWLIDGVEIRRETGEAAAAYAENAGMGMQVHFNIWPGDASFGGNFSPSILPVHQYVDWVQFSSFADGAFTEAWREDFDGAALPTGWLTGTWPSPKNRSTHDPANVNFIEGYAVLSLTADDATGPSGAMPVDDGSGSGGRAGSGGSAATGGGGAGSSSRPIESIGCTLSRSPGPLPWLTSLGVAALALFSLRRKPRILRFLGAALARR